MTKARFQNRRCLESIPCSSFWPVYTVCVRAAAQADSVKKSSAYSHSLTWGQTRHKPPRWMYQERHVYNITVLFHWPEFGAGGLMTSLKREHPKQTAYNKRRIDTADPADQPHPQLIHTQTLVLSFCNNPSFSSFAFFDRNHEDRVRNVYVRREHTACTSSKRRRLNRTCLCRSENWLPNMSPAPFGHQAPFSAV